MRRRVAVLGADFHFTRIAASTRSASAALMSRWSSSHRAQPALRAASRCGPNTCSPTKPRSRARWAFATDDRLLAAIPLSHSYGFTTLALSALVRGLTLVVPADRGPFSLARCRARPRRDCVPDRACVHSGAAQAAPPPAWPDSIRLVISAGAVLPSATAAQFRQTYGQPVHVFYGASECGGICYDREGGAAERGTVGDAGRRRPTVARAARRARGGRRASWWWSHRASARLTCRIGTRLDSGRFETSDVGAWQGGELALLRRVDRVINVRGRKVDPAEVERVLSDARWRRGSRRHRHALGRRTGRNRARGRGLSFGRPTIVKSRRGAGSDLADHKVPRSVVFVDAIPRTPRGKIDSVALSVTRRACRSIYRRPGDRRVAEPLTDPALAALTLSSSPAPACTASRWPRCSRSRASWSLMLGRAGRQPCRTQRAGMFPRCAWLGPNITRLPDAPGTQGRRRAHLR